MGWEAQWEVVDGALKSIFDTGEHSDFTILCQGKEWKIHKFMFRHSKFFRGAFEGPFKESQQGFVDLSEEHPDLLCLAIRWVYSADPTTTYRLDETIPRQNALRYSQLYSLAKRLDLTSVAAFCDEGFLSVAYSVTKLLRDYSAEELPIVLADLVEDVYSGTESTDRALRNTLIGLAVRMLQDTELLPNKREVIEAMFSRSIEFAADVSLKLASLVPHRPGSRDWTDTTGGGTPVE